MSPSEAEPASADAPANRIDRRAFLAGGLRAGGALAIGALGVDAVIPRSSAAAVRRRIAGAQGAARPNILVVMVDQLRSPCWFGAAPRGAAALPPAIAALARRGVSFARHY